MSELIDLFLGDRRRLRGRCDCGCHVTLSLRSSKFRVAAGTRSYGIVGSKHTKVPVPDVAHYSRGERIVYWFGADCAGIPGRMIFLVRLYKAC
jgi:hypothetical protein